MSNINYIYLSKLPITPKIISPCETVYKTRSGFYSQRSNTHRNFINSSTEIFKRKQQQPHLLKPKPIKKFQTNIKEISIKNDKDNNNTLKLKMPKNIIKNRKLCVEDVQNIFKDPPKTLKISNNSPSIRSKKLSFIQNPKDLVYYNNLRYRKDIMNNYKLKLYETNNYFSTTDIFKNQYKYKNFILKNDNYDQFDIKNNFELLSLHKTSNSCFNRRRSYYNKFKDEEDKNNKIINHKSPTREDLNKRFFDRKQKHLQHIFDSSLTVGFKEFSSIQKKVDNIEAVFGAKFDKTLKTIDKMVKATMNEPDMSIFKK